MLINFNFLQHDRYYSAVVGAYFVSFHCCNAGTVVWKPPHKVAIVIWRKEELVLLHSCRYLVSDGYHLIHLTTYLWRNRESRREREKRERERERVRIKET